MPGSGYRRGTGRAGVEKAGRGGCGIAGGRKPYDLENGSEPGGNNGLYEGQRAGVAEDAAVIGRLVILIEGIDCGRLGGYDKAEEEQQEQSPGEARATTVRRFIHQRYYYALGGRLVTGGRAGVVKKCPLAGWAMPFMGRRDWFFP